MTAELDRVVQPDVPRPGPAHREPAEHDPLAVDRSEAAAVQLLDRALNDSTRLEHVRFAGPAVGVVPAAVHFELT